MDDETREALERENARLLAKRRSLGVGLKGPKLLGGAGATIPPKAGAQPIPAGLFKRGKRARCEACGAEYVVLTSRRLRLRSLSCKAVFPDEQGGPDGGACGGRLRLLTWPGWLANGAELIELPERRP